MSSTSSSFYQEGSTVTGVTLTETVVTYAALPASPTVGQRAFVTDCTVATFGASAAGGGSNMVPVYYDGAWKVG